METMVTECPHCRQRFDVDARSSGQTYPCGACGTPFAVREHVPQLNRYQDPRRTAPDPHHDELLSPPVKTPSWRETPVLRTSFTGHSAPPVTTEAPQAAPSVAQSRPPVAHNRTSPQATIPADAPSYRVLRLLASLHTYSGGTAVVAGVILTLTAAGTGSGFAWGVGLALYGVLAVTLGQALTALRDLAINSFAMTP